MKQGTKNRISLMAASLTMMSYLAPTGVLADIAAAFPEASTSTVQMVISMPSLVSIAMALVAGRLTHRFHKRTLVLTGVAIMAVAGPLPFLFRQSMPLLLASAGLLGVGMGINMTCVAALICDCFEGSARSFMLGLQGAFISAGGTLFNLLGGQLGKTAWYNSTLSYLFLFPVLVLLLVLLPRGRLDAKAGAAANRPQPVGGAAAQGAKAKPLPFAVAYYSIIGFVLFLFIAVFNSNVSMLVQQRSLGGAGEAGIAAMCFTFAGILAGVLVAKSVRLLRKRLLPVVMLLAALALLLCYLAPSLWLLCLGGMLAGFAFQTFTPAGNLFVADEAVGGSRSFNIAVFCSASNLGTAISPLVLGALFAGDVVAPRFLLAAAVFLVLVPITALLAKRVIVPA